MPQIQISDEEIAAVVLPAVRRVFRDVQANWKGPGVGLCLKVATLTMKLFDEAADVNAPAGMAEAAQSQQKNAERIAKAIFDAILAAGGPLN